MSTEVVLRFGAKFSDGVAIERIMKSSGFFEEVSGEVEGAIEDLRVAVESGESDYFFAEIDGRVVGYISFSTIPCSENTYMFEWIAVDNAMRGKGIGYKLMEGSFDYMRSKGARKAYLQTSGRPQYLPTRKFYEKCGFYHEATLADYYVKSDPCFYYTKDL